MNRVSADFAMGLDIELHTIVEGMDMEKALGLLFAELDKEAPSLPGPSGRFYPYGRIYPDLQHLEIATRECADPYAVPLVSEQLQQLLRRGIARLAERGTRLVLGTITHNGLLARGGSTWAAHESYCVEQDPVQFGELILPFLATRSYTGAGAFEQATGRFLASGRAFFMERESGGETTGERAMHSLARDENHMGATSGRYRYHLILGDGHRSHYSLALQGTTALALKAIFFNPDLVNQLPRRPAGSSSFWLRALRLFNRLAKPDEPPRFHRVALRIQRVYLEGARRYADSLRCPPAWVPRLLDDWEQTLTALERDDRAFLTTRLDPFIKHQLFTMVLRAQGHTWKDVPKHQHLAEQLALLHQKYHELDPASPFEHLEQVGVLRHRVGEPIPPGSELEPFVPQTTTRARARARFICAHRHEASLLMDWSGVHDLANRRQRPLEDPFADDFGDWQPSEAIGGLRGRLERTADEILAHYDRGDYERAQFLIRMVRPFQSRLSSTHLANLQRHAAWVQARRGFLDGVGILDELYGNRPHTLSVVTDYVCVYRYQGLVPPAEIDDWLQEGTALLSQEPDGHVVPFLGHCGYILHRRGRYPEALVALTDAHRPERFRHAHPHSGSRVLAELGEIHRLLGSRVEADEFLQQAEQLQTTHHFEGDLADFTWTYRAKLETEPVQRFAWLARAKAAQLRLRNGMGEARTLLLEARLCPDERLAAANRARVLQLRDQLPALGRCPLLARILEQWQSWLDAPEPDGNGDLFWGV